MNNIKAIRQLLGLSQQALADALGCRQSTITHYELGRIDPSQKMGAKIRVFAEKRGLQLTLDQIYGSPSSAKQKPKTAAPTAVGA